MRWRAARGSIDPQRAAWIVRLLRPNECRVAHGLDRTDLPVVSTWLDEGKDAAWRSAPKARLLPVRWIAIVQGAGAYRRRRRAPRHPAGARCRPDPQVDGDNASEIPAIRRQSDPGMRWMVDFDEAEAAGMGPAHRAHRCESRRTHREPDRARV
jgi:hypothetical protein